MGGIFGVRECEESGANGWVAGRAFRRRERLRERQVWNEETEFVLLCWVKVPSGHPNKDGKLVAGCAILTKSRGKVWAVGKNLRVFIRPLDTISGEESADGGGEGWRTALGALWW